MSMIAFTLPLTPTFPERCSESFLASIVAYSPSLAAIRCNGEPVSYCLSWTFFNFVLHTPEIISLT